MHLVENEETGLEEIRGLVCDGLDESVMTLQMRLAHKGGGEEEVYLSPGTYRQLAYAKGHHLGDHWQGHGHVTSADQELYRSGEYHDQKLFCGRAVFT